MVYSEKIEKKINGWIRGTALSGHFYDEGRFYEVILAFWNEEERIWDEAEFTKVATERLSEYYKDEEYLNDQIDMKRSIGTEVLSFLSYCKEKDIKL